MEARPYWTIFFGGEAKKRDKLRICNRNIVAFFVLYFLFLFLAGREMMGCKQ